MNNNMNMKNMDMKNNLNNERNEKIEEITLDCLVNPVYTQENKAVTSSQTKIKLKEKKFYKKRILYHTQKWLEEKEDFANAHPDIQKAFDKYIRCLIQHFKTTDFNDILQEEFKELDALNDILDDDDTNNNNDNDNDPSILLMNRYIPILEQKKKSTLDSFVKKISREGGEEEDTIFIPLQKKINLKEPSLKTKGIYQNQSSYEK
jgi:disulfide oxidoreductase YuzD